MGTAAQGSFTEGVRYLSANRGIAENFNLSFAGRIIYIDLPDPITTDNFFRMFSIRARKRNILHNGNYPYTIVEISYMGNEDDIEEAMESLEEYAMALTGNKYKEAREKLFSILKERGRNLKNLTIPA